MLKQLEVIMTIRGSFSIKNSDKLNVANNQTLVRYSEITGKQISSIILEAINLWVEQNHFLLEQHHVPYYDQTKN